MFQIQQKQTTLMEERTLEHLLPLHEHAKDI